MQFELFDLGLINFKKAWQFQKEVFKTVKIGYIKSALIFCQHCPVITLGRQSKKENIKVTGSELKNNGIQIYEIERAGDVTYHGPGQLTIYPIFNLNYLKKDINWFLRCLENVVIDFLADFGIEGKRCDGLTGVWVENKKIASVGIAIKNWITFHGLSINIKKEDLVNFNFIKPCGIDIEMTSLDTALNRNIEIEDIKDNLIQKFRAPFRLACGVSLIDS